MSGTRSMKEKTQRMTNRTDVLPLLIAKYDCVYFFIYLETTLAFQTDHVMKRLFTAISHFCVRTLFHTSFSHCAISSHRFESASVLMDARRAPKAQKYLLIRT